MAPVAKFTLHFEHCSYIVQVSLEGKAVAVPAALKRCIKTKDKVLLSDVSASVSSGHVLAILGPSGAGKTTLLNMLTLQRKGGQPYGSVMINGTNMDGPLYREHCAYVQQQDALWASLTTREHLSYAFALCRPGVTGAAREAGIDSLLEELSLKGKPEHTQAGNQFMGGLSSGLKRRLSIALALTKQPSILFLDEPTTGVDSASAAKIMGFLKQIAAEKNVAIACTIHQPPASVFKGFDDNLVLASGRIAYFGPAADMGVYFTALGRPPAAGVNLAEFVLDLVNKDFTAPAQVDELLNAWASSEAAQHATPRAIHDKGLPQVARSSGFCSQVMSLTSRQLLLARRDPMLYVGRIVANLFVTTFFSILYLSTRERVQDQVQTRCFFVLFFTTMPLQFNLVAVLAEYFYALSLRREIKDGLFTPLTSSLASWIVQPPFMFVTAASAMVTPFAIGDLDWRAFPQAWLIYGVTNWSFEGYGQFFALASHPLLGLMNFMQLFFAMFLFCGMFIDLTNLTWVFRWMAHAMPLQYTISLMVHTIFIYTPDYEDAYLCTPGEIVNSSVVPYPFPGSQYPCSARAFYCPGDATGFVCLGRTGSQILDSLSNNFSNLFKSEENVTKGLLIIGAGGVLFRIFYLVQLYAQTSNVQAPVPPLKVLPGSTPVEPSKSSSKHIAVSSKKVSDPDLELTQELNVEAEMLPAAPGAQGATSVLVVKGLECISPAPAGVPCMPKKENKKVLSGVSLEIPGGDVMAIIGPSDGDGTVLLNALSLEKTSTVAYGVLELDGVPITPANYAHLCSYVPNAETLWPMMTARKHLEYAFRLMRPDLTGAAMVKAVDELLLATGMVSCQHTKAGDALRQGLSGGQKRRLMMALGLVSRPKVLLLDEPTSGLDSAAAAAITRLLKDIALKNGTSILCTIQQPSAAVYAKFDRLLLLSMGRVAYSGTRIGAAGYFAKIGKTFPAAANPAEFLVDEVSKDMTSIEAVEVVLDQWRKHVRSVSPALSPKQAKAKLHARQARAGLCTQIVVLTQRTFEMAFADPVIYLVRMFVVAFIITFFGIVYLESANQVQEQISFRLFFLWWLLCVPPALDIVAVFYYNIELQTARAEMKTGAYGTFAYVVANTAVQLPMMFALALCACIPGYGLGGFPWDNFVTFWIAYALSLWAFECLGQACALLRNPIIGILQFMNVWACALIFTGLVFRGEDVIWPFRILIWLFPLRWLFNSAAYDIFVPAIYEGTLPCTYGSLVNTSTGPSMCFSDFYCPDVPLTQCAGRTGIVILKNLNRNFETLNDKDERGIDILIIIAIALVYKLIFCKGVADMSQHAAIKKPDGKLIARTASTSASVAMQANAEADDLSAA